MQNSQAALLQQGTKDALVKAAEKEVLAGELAKKAAAETAKKGIASYLTPGNVLLGTSLLGGLLAEEPEQPELTEDQKRMMRTGERTDYVGRDIVPRYDYSMETASSFAQGGFIQGPGTGTSDSIPAMIYQDGKPVQEARLSNNEFVFTEKAVQGAGGPARMYEMMKQYERMS